jgi:YVTN family beta-propeller protein
MISNTRAVWAVLLIAIFGALVAGCGDVFRPTINFEPQPQGNPASLGQAVILSTNPGGNGSDTHIDVSGDTNVGVVNVGANPVFIGNGAGRAFILNGDNTVSIYTALLPQSSIVNLVTLPPTTSGAIAGAASSNGNIYIADSGSNDVNVIGAGQIVVTQTVAVGARPVMVAANASGNKAYVINHDDNTVTIIGTQDNVVAGTIPVGAQPIWGVMSDDGIDVFVINQGEGTVSVIDTTLDRVICTPASPSAMPPPSCTSTINLDNKGTNAALASNYAFYDNVRKRVYVTNPGDNSVTVIKADSINLGVTPQILPQFLAKVTLSGSPVSVGAIADGTRAYAALGNCPAGINHTNLLTNLAGCTGNQVSVIDVVGLVQKSIIPVGAGSVSIAPATDGTKVYVANALDKSISVIRTATDSELTRMPAPQQSLGCPNPATCTATGAQTPFMVLTFP